MIKTNLHKIEKQGNVEYLTFPILNSFKNLRHGFTTRLGGVSTGCFSQMNLSFTTGDNPDTVRQNYKIISNALGINPNNLVLSAQTHTANILCVGKNDVGKGVWRDKTYSDIDAIVTNQPSVALVTHSADCCLIGFFDPVNNVIAAAHAGWRGTVQEIGKKTVQVLINNYNCNPKNIIAVLAPSVARCCYEVDDPVYNEFSKLSYLDLSKIFQKKENGRYMLNLVEANKQILINVGIPYSNFDLSDICTCCNSDVMHSHRKTKGERGNLALIIELK